MNLITQILYWISTGLLIPVVILLLILFIRSLLLIGSFYSLYIHKTKFNKQLNDAMDGMDDTTVIEKLAALPHQKKLMLSNCLQTVQHTKKAEIYLNKVLNDYEMACRKDLSGSQTLAKMGPLLGLMGTLIPMGPALVGLASGDIASMASNMQVAFATTVIGLFAGAIGFVVQQIKKRWFTTDMLNLEFVSELLIQSSIK